MLNLTRRLSKKAGLPPGTLAYMGKKQTEPVRTTVMDYDETNLLEQEIETIEECFPFKDQPSVTWIHIEGIHQENVIDAIGKHFGVHPLVLEDLINMGQRPKMEAYENYIFIVLRMLCYDDENADVEDKQVGLIVGSDFVVSVLETGGDTFKEIRERIRSGQGRVRKMRADYLVYALMDITVDNYFIILEKLADQIELIEEELVTNPTPHTLQKIYHMKRMMIRMRKSVWPLREVVSKMERGESDLFTEDTQIYLRDLYDHTLEVIEAVELLREMVSSMLDMYLSSISHKMNEVMKVLTIIATIFIPITFIASIYGMNFDRMPELKSQWGYPIILTIMAMIVISMLVYFRRKKWF